MPEIYFLKLEPPNSVPRLVSYEKAFRGPGEIRQRQSCAESQTFVETLNSNELNYQPIYHFSIAWNTSHQADIVFLLVAADSPATNNCMAVSPPLM